MKSQRKIYLDMIGCRLNQSELEHIGKQVRLAGHKLVGDVSQADLAIVNTCAVTSKAAADSRQLSRNLERSGIGEIILTGCWATLEPDVASTLPGVFKVVANVDKDQLVSLALPGNIQEFELEPDQRRPIPGARKRTRAFIKVQDGCDKRCTFCITTIARGKATSLSIAGILEDIQAAAASGVKEVILTGVQLGAWGTDLSRPLELADLVDAILKHTEIPRVRLSSIEPWSITPSLIERWRDPRLCRQLHIPLQSGSATTLRRMGRPTNPERYQALIKEIRKNISDIAITTDMIVGFPGETETEFTESMQYLKALQFAGGHVFTYSEREGTAAANFPNVVHNVLRQERSRKMRAQLESSGHQFRSRFIDRTLSVLWESLIKIDGQNGTISGKSSEGFRVHATGRPEFRNTISKVRVASSHMEGYLQADPIERPFQA